MHVYCIGATGSGKSNYLLSDIEGAFCFIDKHGTTARQIADTCRCSKGCACGHYFRSRRRKKRIRDLRKRLEAVVKKLGVTLTA